MKDVFCYGIIPLRFIQDKWHVLLIRHKKGCHWSFPKGHQEIGEEGKETAKRELKEETGLDVVNFLSNDSLTERYHFSLKGEHIHKTVTYFLADVSGELALQEEEIAEAKWALLSEAEDKISFKEGKLICKRAKHLLSSI